VVNLAGQDHALSVWPSADPLGPMTFRFHDGEQGGFRDTIVVESVWVPGENVFSGLIDGAPFVAQIVKTLDGYRLWHRGASVSAKVLTPVAAALSRYMIERVAPDTSKFLLCPMPGLVVSINVEEGQEVKAGEPLAVVEAMKMENVLRAEKDATIAKINARKGDSLAVDAVIMEFAPA
jgi:propionyl-CoA carboxylase alpha chain